MVNLQYRRGTVEGMLRNLKQKLTVRVVERNSRKSGLAAERALNVGVGLMGRRLGAAWQRKGGDRNKNGRDACACRPELCVK
jgi:hypothetical protein